MNYTKIQKFKYSFLVSSLALVLRGLFSSAPRDEKRKKGHYKCGKHTLIKTKEEWFINRFNSFDDKPKTDQIL